MLLHAELILGIVLLLGLLLLIIDRALVVLRRMVLLYIQDVLVDFEWFGGPLADGLVEAIEATWNLFLA